MSGLKRSTVFTTLMVAVMVAMVAAVPLAFGQSAPVNAKDVAIANQVTVNQCSAGEPVALSGSVHVEYSISTDSSGANIFAISAANKLSGSGQNSGTLYSAADSADYTVTSRQASADATVELKADLAPQGGSATTMTLIQTLHVTVDTAGNLAVDVVKNNTTCGGN